MNKKTRKKAYKYGLVAEFVAVWWLRFKGYRILARRYKTHLGEVDIIASRRDSLVAVEVKARRRGYDLWDVVTERQLQRILKAAMLFVAKNPKFASFTVRLDLIIICPWSCPRHMQNYWYPSTDF